MRYLSKFAPHGYLHRQHCLIIRGNLTPAQVFYQEMPTIGCIDLTLLSAAVKVLYSACVVT